MSAQDSDFIVWAFNRATREPYSHFFIDFSQRTIPDLRFKSNNFGKNSQPIIVYVQEEPD